MSKLSRLIGMASEALEKNSGSGRGSSSNDSGSTDWTGMLRGAVDAVRGPADQTPRETGGRPSASPAGSPADPYAPPPAPGAVAGSPSRPGARPGGAGSDADRAAIARYDYLLQTADPHRIEQIHRDAFARLTPQQRSLVEERMRAEFSPGERPRSSSPDDLARAAGRAEALRPGKMRGLLSRVRGAGVGGGAAVVAGGAAVGVLGAVAGGAVLSTVAAPLLEQAAGLGVDFSALAEGIDIEALASGVDVDALAGGAEGIVGSVGESVSGLGETATGWGDRLGDLGIPGIGDIFGR
ncbi:MULTISPECIES: cation-transporting ATPase [unclassified Microbacterium]|uniref:cation-transporting ATPase n=1 Tax=unclassified Microbacterium TaxID=2609290 RepID=UPI000EA9CCE1|nr:MULTISPECIES: cation-transporting ATPase [unclassified Microbacterium]MBT2485253.1 cation-transporting ATPase [Microbacterium sp. ISL-108]RKN68071.1 cation-transporting ATPase [Microbacterium sp. CGR2]